MSLSIIDTLHINWEASLHCSHLAIVHKTKASLPVVSPLSYFFNSMGAALLFLIASLVSLCGKVNTCELYLNPTKSNSANVSCPATTSHDCHTLNEWITNGSNPFTDNTVVTLLPGVHLITSKNKTVYIENVTSLKIVGHQSRMTAISCVYGTSFEFYFITNITIAFVEFESCAIDGGNIIRRFQDTWMGSTY